MHGVERVKSCGQHVCENIFREFVLTFNIKKMTLNLTFYNQQELGSDIIKSCKKSSIF